MEPSFDIQSPSSQTTSHGSRRFVMFVSIVVVILAIVLIVMRVQQKRAREAYLATPHGQLQALSESSKPVTETPVEQVSTLEALQKSSRKVNASSSERLQALPAQQ